MTTTSKFKTNDIIEYVDEKSRFAGFVDDDQTYPVLAIVTGITEDRPGEITYWITESDGGNVDSYGWDEDIHEVYRLAENPDPEVKAYLLEIVEDYRP